MRCLPTHVAVPPSPPAERTARIEWLRGDIRTWRPDEPFDLIFSNAVLHWVEESHGSKHKEVRYLDIHEAEEIDEGQLEAWVRQASEIPGWGTSSGGAPRPSGR